MIFTATLVSIAQARPQDIVSWKEGQILVKPRANVSQKKFKQILKRKGGKSLGKLRKLNIHVVEVPVNAESAVARALSKNRNIAFAEKDRLVQMAEVIPDDPRFADAWHLSTVQAPAAWDVAKANGVTIAVLDSGVDSLHPDLGIKLLPGWNSVSGNTNTEDIAGHGTMVAGTAAAATNNGRGVAGIAWHASILPVRVSNSGTGAAYTSDIANGLTWAADNGADVANISYQVSTSSTVISAAKYMRGKGGLVVVAGGNNGRDTGLNDNPALIVASATSPEDVLADFSNYGDNIDVAAPGVDILTTTLGGGYDFVAGTSFASPATAGVVALIMGINPSLSPDEVESILEQSADDLVAGVDWHPYYGHGRINAAAAVQMTLDIGGVPADYEAPSLSIHSPFNNNTVSRVVPVDITAQDNVGVTEVALYANGQLIGVDYSAPYQVDWDTTHVSDGPAILTARAYDAAGNEGYSNEVTVLVENAPVDSLDSVPPTVNIINPKNGDTVSRTVTIDVKAYDDVELSRVELYIDGQLMASSVNGALTYDWNTRKLGNGIHVIEAVASDAAGNIAKLPVELTVGKNATNDSGSKGNGKGKK
ncbi:peptidase S8 [Seongchinamella unica]|uniref:Peptidase S8 n=2 Tax=Seongchinamella unica TaxID=2547392 RepID=A0A4R5LX01_9GAMM|nr:peptidase S8 [Seongchinamella unica]